MTPKAITDRLEEAIGADGTPRRLTDAIEHELVSSFALAPIQAAERVERITPAVAKIITERLVECEERGIGAVLAVVGATLDVVVGYCHVLPDDSPQISEFKRNRNKAGDLLSAIRALNFDEFEHFGARLLVELGATRAKVTPQRGDQGIDFFGTLILGQSQGHPQPFLKLAHDVQLGFIGQAKHYPLAALAPAVVRELAGAVTLARAKAFSRDGLDLFDDLELKAFSPLVALLFTTGGLTAGSRRLADSAGIIARSGEQLALFLAEKGVGMTDTPAGRIFDLNAFREWLSPS